MHESCQIHARILTELAMISNVPSMIQAKKFHESYRILSWSYINLTGAFKESYL